jgi:hypothetical protein
MRHVYLFIDWLATLHLISALAADSCPPPLQPPRPTMDCATHPAASAAARARCYRQTCGSPSVPMYPWFQDNPGLLESLEPTSCRKPRSNQRAIYIPIYYKHGNERKVFTFTFKVTTLQVIYCPDVVPPPNISAPSVGPSSPYKCHASPSAAAPPKKKSFCSMVRLKPTLAHIASSTCALFPLSPCYHSGSERGDSHPKRSVHPTLPTLQFPLTLFVTCVRLFVASCLYSTSIEFSNPLALVFVGIQQESGTGCLPPS